ncbi:PhzF family phenazine biosynthesis protein [Alteromonas stellipolaris]|uniref:PhzF family phenazine biosynthesis protein n=1 Tax=Alteromonas stellipolaris TaxID=233316 RepID=UPI0027342D8B|nr:PhzF family phenazine biosynthesis protein [Alteromonas stellipolaris]MDP2535738.1 PhzF family phenazine biosynthesis protein [Alteromonas stellipolaris]
MKVSVEIVNAFIDGDTGGNSAGVVLNANALTAQQKLHVAQKVGLSETAFVSRSDVATIKLEFFTPVQQIAHCGHATIATFSRMSELGLVQNGRMSKETVDGVREIIIDGSMAFMEQSPPTYTDVLDTEEVRAALNLSSDVLLDSVTIVNTGNAFLLVPLQNASSVAEIHPNQALINEISEQYDLIGFYVFSGDTEVDGRHAGARMFAPRYGIDEESATGMAAGPLACYLHDRQGLEDTTLLIEQGHLMDPPSPSVINVNLQLVNGSISRLMAGGVGRSIRQVEIEI